MIGLLTPDEYYHTVYDIDLEKLVAAGFRAVILDVDNTLVAWDDHSGAPDGLKDWISGLREHGLQVVLVSNNTMDRVDALASILELPAVAQARKPLQKAYVRAMDMAGSSPAQTVMVGDQLFTDVLGANAAGLHTILVVPISGQEFAGTRLVRQLERLVLDYLKRSGRLSLARS